MICQKCGNLGQLYAVDKDDMINCSDKNLQNVMTWFSGVNRKICANCVRGRVQEPERKRCDLYDWKYDASKQLERGEITPERYTDIVRVIDYQLSQLKGV